MPKLQFTSESESDSEPEIEIPRKSKSKKTPSIPPPPPPPPVSDVIPSKVKKERTERQKEVTRKMREALENKRLAALKLKDEENYAKQKLKTKLKIKKKVEKEVNKKIQELAVESESESEASEPEVIKKPKRKSKPIERPSSPIQKQPVTPRAFNVRFF